MMMMMMIMSFDVVFVIAFLIALVLVVVEWNLMLKSPDLRLDLLPIGVNLTDRVVVV
jgi:hypothetical protein